MTAKALKSKSSTQESQDKRKHRGQVDRTVMFPAAPTQFELPKDYALWLSDLKENIRKTRFQTILASNAAMVLLYWDIGGQILDKQQSQGWGAKVIDRLSLDLGKAFPEMKGFSPRNLKYMRAFRSHWPDLAIVQEALAQLPWSHNITLIEKLSTVEERLWYARQAFKYGWSQPILFLQIGAQAYLRSGKALNNFPATLPSTESDMAVQVFKDPYLFDFLGTDAPRREAELESGLMEHMQKFLLELGQGFAFVGRQVHLEMGDQDFYIDLLFYHLTLRRYVVAEVKAREFKPGDSAQLGMYMTAVNKLLNHPDDKPALGLLLVKTKNKVLVEYALDGINHPMSVAEWETQLTQSLPENLRESLPTIEELEAEFKNEDAEEVVKKI